MTVLGNATHYIKFELQSYSYFVIHDLALQYVLINTRSCAMVTKSEKDEKKYTREQKLVLYYRNIAFIVLFCFTVAGLYIPFPKLHLPTLLDRVVFTLRWLIVSLVTICIGVTVVGNIRFKTSAINPLELEERKLTELPQRYLQNTLEQFMLHSFSLLALSTYLSEENMHWIPLLVAFFVIARVVFFVGYFTDAIKRIPGFVLTFLPTLAVGGYCLYCMCVYGAQTPHSTGTGRSWHPPPARH